MPLIFKYDDAKFAVTFGHAKKVTAYFNDGSGKYEPEREVTNCWIEVLNPDQTRFLLRPPFRHDNKSEVLGSVTRYYKDRPCTRQEANRKAFRKALDNGWPRISRNGPLHLFRKAIWEWFLETQKPQKQNPPKAVCVGLDTEAK